VDAADLDGEWPRANRDLDLRRGCDDRLAVASRAPLLALAGERHPARERQHDEEQETGDRRATTTLPPAYRIPSSAEALVRVQ
jgi:hypothetical protein